MEKYILSKAAQNSLNDICAYTLDNLGGKQTRRYLEKLRIRMQFLADEPEQGKPRDELKVGYFSYFEGSHTIYYRIQPNYIDIIDVLHQSMDPERHGLSGKE